MVKFVAYKAEDNRSLSELSGFKNIKNNYTRKGEGKAFDAHKGNVDIHADGKAMLFVLKKPVSGTLNKLYVSVDGSQQYEVTGLSIKLNSFKNYFKSGFESKIFSGNDTITGSSQGDTLAGFNGVDTISAGSGNDSVGGNAGNDKLYGEDGNDVIVGAKGNDLIDGGRGQNVVQGNSGNNKFLFDSQLSVQNHTSITDFKPGQDKFWLENSVFPSIGPDGTLSSAKFVLSTAYAGQAGVVIYDKAVGTLSYAATAGPLSNAIAFGDVGANTNLSSSDFLVV